ncbi:peptidylprolyl isomerase [Sphingomonas sp. 1P06PA]|uniref:peptidylprolyl isomerase n=1 Tax=Sphingomonas sp. 1P06PA TaxID=554121 RepID=UPI0039A4D571
MSLILAFAALQAAAHASAAGTPPAPSTPSGIVAAAPDGDWAEVPAGQLLIVDAAGGRRLVIELAPDWAPVHVANIRTLAKAGWWDGTSINRVQDNYVVQWGDATERKPLPPGIAAKPPAEYERPSRGLAIRPLGGRDAYADATGHAAGGWPVARDTRAGTAWLPHCYGMVGVGRNVAPDTGTGAELYTVIGHAPRHLDRNITVVGRVLSGIESVAGLPRGTEALGFYADPAQRTAIERIRLASDLPEAERPRFQVMRTDSRSFAAWVKARANRKDDFFVRPAGAVDICNAQAPVRAKP